ncbi:tetraspanin-15-like isoform X1 [Styela clava]
MKFSEGKDGTQAECLCCCGIRSAKSRTSSVYNRTVTDGTGIVEDGVDGGNNIKTCICCWCMGCDQEGVYVWLKNLLLLYNFIFWLLGFCLISLGVYSEIMRQQYSSEANAVFLTPSVVLCFIGSFCFIFATLGGIGALRDNLCMLKTFVYSILFFVIIELTCGILALVFKEPAKDFVNHFILKGLTTYYDDRDMKDVIDYVQREFQCCGGELYRDWEVNVYHNCTAPGPTACGVPYSCCLQENGTININSMCGYDTINLKIFEANSFVYTEGCINAVIDFFLINLNVLAGILLGVFLPQITGILLGTFYASCIADIMRKQRDSNFQIQTEIDIKALDEENLISDSSDKRYSYPRYVKRPSLISEGKFTPTASVREESRHPNLTNVEAGKLLMRGSPSSCREETAFL